MRIRNSLLPGLTAFAAIGAAQAADLPSRKAAPAEYVKICDAYGSGFFYIPGTDTCLKVGGYVRAEYIYATPDNIVTVPTFRANAATASASNATFVTSAALDQTGFQGRGRVELDARTQTAFGTARTYIGIRSNVGTGLYADNYTTNTFTGAGGSAGITLENAIIQFAGFTFGHTPSDVFAYLPGEAYTLLANYQNPPGYNLLSYTATFGGGFSASIGVEDRSTEVTATLPGYIPNAANGGIYSLPTTGANAYVTSGSNGQLGSAFTNGPLTYPVLEANLRVDQSWGNAQIMGAVDQNSALSTFSNVPNFTVEKTGFSIGAGLRINLPMFAKGDHLLLTGAYADGFLDGLQPNNTSSHLADIGRTIPGFQRIDRNMYVLPLVGGGFTSESTTGFSIAGAFTHYFTPTLRTVILASYIDLTPGQKTQNTDWTLGGLSEATVFQVAGQLVFTPVSNLEVGGEVSYNKLDQHLTGSNGAAPTAVPAVFTNAPVADDAIVTRLRVTRQF